MRRRPRRVTKRPVVRLRSRAARVHTSAPLMPRYILLKEIAVDRCYDPSDPRALGNCREWLRRHGLRSTGGGRYNRAQYLAVMDRVERTPKPKPSALQKATRLRNLGRGRGRQARTSDA